MRLPTLEAKRVLESRTGAIAFAGQRFAITGRLPNARRGERVRVQLVRDGQVERERQVEPARGRRRGQGRFRVGFTTALPGSVRVVAVREPPAGTSATSLSLRVVPAALAPGSRGAVVRAVQRRLPALRFSVGVTGRYDRRTALAVLAFRSVNRLPRTNRADAAVLSLLARGRGAYRPRFARRGRHVEADLGRRVVALVQGRRVVRVLHTSPGRASTPSPIGSFRFYAKHRGRNRTGMLHSSFFLRGYAVHGYDFVPPFPDSHGCLRIPNRDALFAFRWIRTGDRIDVYRSRRSRTTDPRKGTR